MKKKHSYGRLKSLKEKEKKRQTFINKKILSYHSKLGFDVFDMINGECNT
jgi:hypothetical protein